MASDPKPLPPGNTGLPFLGETLPFLKDGFGFVESRAAQHGPVFRTKILGRDTAVITGADASGEFINAQHVQRGEAMLPHIQELFGGSALPTLDGEEHLERKRFVLAAFTRDALAAYLPVMQKLLASHLARWAQGGELRLLEAFKRLTLEIICTTIFGLEPGPQIDQLYSDYELIGGGFANLPIPLPGTAYSKAKAALQRVLAVYEANIRDHQARPRDDGLSRILAARSQTSGRPMTVDEAKVELHHIVVAGLIEWGWFVTTMVELDKNPEVRAKALAEIERIAPSGPLTLGQLHEMKFLDELTMEIRRVSPVVHVFFGKAREDFEFKGHSIPAGWMVLWGIRSSHLRPETYQDPGKFEPGRFAPERAEHLKSEHAFVPNGAGPATGHKCAGWEFAPYLLKVFTVELLRGCTWTFPPQDFGYDWSKIPPEPKDGLRAKVTKR